MLVTLAAERRLSLDDLAPLGLHDSFIDTNVARLPISAVRYDGSGNPIPYYPTSTPPSGELYASARDLIQFAVFNMKNQVKGRAQILDHRWIDELHKPVFSGPSGVGDDVRLVFRASKVRCSTNFQEWRTARRRDTPVHGPVGKPCLPGLVKPIQWTRPCA